MTLVLKNIDIYWTIGVESRKLIEFFGKLDRKIRTQSYGFKDKSSMTARLLNPVQDCILAPVCLFGRVFSFAENELFKEEHVWIIGCIMFFLYQAAQYFS